MNDTLDSEPTRHYLSMLQDNITRMATNSVLSDTSGLIMSQISDIELLNPGADYAYEIHLMNGHVKTLRLKFIWDDDYESNRDVAFPFFGQPIIRLVS